MNVHDVHSKFAMMRFFKSILRLIYHQAQNAGKVVSRQPLNYPSLGSVTLDREDVAIAEKYLKCRLAWDDPGVVTAYERKFANWNGSKHAFAFMGGRVALSACIHALGLKAGDEVLLPGYTCVVVSNAFRFAGIKTVFCDIELDTYGLDASLVEEKITQKTRAIMLHHLYGLVCRDYEKIIALAEKHGLKVIEDCAHATGAIYKGRKVGNYGDIAFYSSEQSKVFTTIMGGVATTSDDAIARRLREYYENAPSLTTERIEMQLKTVIYNYYIFKHPLRWLFSDVLPVLNKTPQLITTTLEEIQGIKPLWYGSKMPAPIAKIGLNQLEKIDRYNQKRRETALIWDGWCWQNGYQPPLVVKDSIPIYLRYPVMVEEQKKMDISWAVRELGVQLGVWFVSNLHPADLSVASCPNADKAVRQCINLPTILDP